MADAKNPNAPTEADAITWIRKNSASDLSAFFTNTFLTVYSKAQGWGFLPEVTKIVLSQDILPNINQEALIDRKLLETRRKKWENRACTGNSEKR